MYNLILLSSTYAILLSEGLSKEDTSLLAAFLTSVADNLVLIADSKE